MHLLRKFRSTHRHVINHKNLSFVKMFLLIVFIILFAIIIHLMWISSTSIAQEGTTISGRLIDTTGNPISDITLYLRRNDALNQNSSRISDDSAQIKTDSNGGFTFLNIRGSSLQLELGSYTKKGFEINVLSIEFGEITLYPFRSWLRSKISFGIDPSLRYEGIIIIAEIRERLRIRTRVIYADGSPVANGRVYVYRQSLPFFGEDRGYSKLIKETDAEGYFVEYLTASEYPTYFITLAVEHQNLYAKAVPFIFRENTELVLKLDGKDGSYHDPSLEHRARFLALEAYMTPSPVWVVNPVNNHAYIVTQYQTIKDAMTQAASENAYLVAINDEAEQKWLSNVFGNQRFWIGLSDADEEGKWKWHSGEPVDYTNWKPYQKESGNTETKDYVMTVHNDWTWEVFGDTYQLGNTQDLRTRIGKAIIEKPTKPIK